MKKLPILMTLLFLGSIAVAAVPPAASLPTPGLFCEEARDTTGRLFPEAMQTNDFVSYDEAVCGLTVLENEHPDLLEVKSIAKSVGWENAFTGEHDQFDVLAVEVTNELSPVPREDKLAIVFQLSIHGNEKGGREGGLRVIEDFAIGKGLLADREDLSGMLDYMILSFIFINPDGWVHEEPAYRHNCPDYFAIGTPDGNCVETQNFVRYNGNGVDMNRDLPTAGWVRESHKPMSEPEIIGKIQYLKENFTRVHYASDIHGMLNPADAKGPVSANIFAPVEEQVLAAANSDHELNTRGHFVLTMLPAGRQSTDEMFKSTALAELIKQRLNADPYFTEWQSLPTSAMAWGGEFNDWGTVWDTIGYTDSGFTSDWYAQDIGLSAPGVDFELAYNHVTFDNYYPGASQRINDYHIESVRVIVESFMDHAAKDFTLSVDVKGHRTAYLLSPTSVTEADVEVTGWAAENAADDVVDANHRHFEATPNDYWVDLAKFAKDGDAAGQAVVDPLGAGDVTADRLSGYDNLVVSGSAYDTIAGNAAVVDAIRAWVENGGNLLVTDEALQLLEDLGVADAGSVDSFTTYAGATNFVDKGHPLAADTRGLARQTYEPVPLGYTLQDGGGAPVWFVKAGAFDGETVGVAGEGQTSQPNEEKVNLGRAKLGEGTVTFLGALLPDPTTEWYTPYGVDSYATTYTGNQIVRNALGFVLEHEATDITAEALLGAGGVDAGSGGDSDAKRGIPGFGLVAALAALGAVALARRRR